MAGDPIANEAQSRSALMADAAATVHVSVIIPTFNRRDSVLRAVDSVLAQQGNRKLEVIVVDDGSTDGTVSALNARYGSEACVRVLPMARRGANAARNAGLAQARGDLICLVDSDDQWTERALAVAEQVFETQPQLAFVCLDGSTLPQPDSPPIQRVLRGYAPGWSNAAFATAPLVWESIRLDGQEGETAILCGDFFPAIVSGDLFQVDGLYMRRAAVFGAGPFHERFRWFNDWEFFARLCLQGQGAYVDYAGFRRDMNGTDRLARGHPETAMRRRHLYILHSLPRRFPDSAAKYAKCLRGAMTDAQYQMGAALARSPHRRWAIRYLRRCIRHRYKVERCLVHLVLSWLPVRV